MVERFHFLKHESWGLTVTTDFKIAVCNRLCNTKRHTQQIKSCVEYGYDFMGNVSVTQKFSQDTRNKVSKYMRSPHFSNYKVVQI